MLKFKGLKTKLLFWIGLLIFVSFSISIIVTGIRATAIISSGTYSEASQMASSYANSISNEVNQSMNISRILGQTLCGMVKSKNTDRETVNAILKDILDKDNDLIGTWVCFEPNAFDGKDKEFASKTGNDETGRYIPYYNRSTGSVTLDYLRDYEKQVDGDYYLLAKNTKKEVIMEPFKYKVQGVEIFVTSLVVPIIVDGKFIGAAGVDMSLDAFKSSISKIKPFDTGYASLISNKGIYVANADTKQIGKAIDTSTEFKTMRDDVIGGKSGNLQTTSSIDKSPIYQVYAPINIGETKTPWSLAISVPMSKITEKTNEIRYYSIAISIVSLIIVLGALFVIVDRISRPIKTTTGMLKDIAQGEGDLTKRLNIKTGDEIEELAFWFNTFVSKIEELVAKVKDNAANLYDASNQIAVVMEQSNKGMEYIAGSISEVSTSVESNASIVEETSASIEEFSRSTDIISEQANVAYKNSIEILKSAQQGSENVKEVVNVIGMVKDATDKVYLTVEELKVSSDKIGEIVSIITGISEQTNLLALNAAIEAARAGEQGRGFTVVADEVRKLAEESKESALRISGLVTEIQKKSQEADTSIKEGNEFVKIGVEKTKLTNENFDSILNAIENISSKIEIMSKSSEEQTLISKDMIKAMDEISKSTMNSSGEIQEINAVIEEQVSAFEEITASVDEVNNMISVLRDQTDRFKV